MVLLLYLIGYAAGNGYKVFELYSYLQNRKLRIAYARDVQIDRYRYPLRTVHTALGLPGSSETAISLTARPCCSMRSEERGPRPQSAAMCGWPDLVAQNGAS